MKLVFLDLEYNQQVKTKTKIKIPISMPFEIIEMGLIATDYNFKEIASYNYLVKPTKQTVLNPHVSYITKITPTVLYSQGIEFNNCMNRFEQIVNEKCYIITWGYDDIKILKQNCFNKKYPFSFLKNITHFDAQKAYMRINNISKQPSLKTISDKYSNLINKEHRAIDDVRRLINVCKAVGITNILSQKDAIVNNDNYLPKNYYNYLLNKKNKKIKEELANDLDN